jgi:hypothetical protein
MKLLRVGLVIVGRRMSEPVYIALISLVSLHREVRMGECGASHLPLLPPCSASNAVQNIG